MVDEVDAEVDLKSPGAKQARRTRRWLVWGRRVLLSLVALILVLGVLTWATSHRFATFGGSPSESERARMQTSPRFHDGHFANEEGTTMMKSGSTAVFKEWLLGNQMRAPSCPLPLFPDTAHALSTPASSGLRVTWLGHSTVVIEIDGVRVLTDPMWGDRASPSTLAGPTRFHRPPLSLTDLPPIDAVAISHDHYDHLDMATIQTLATRGVVFHVGLGVGAHLRRWGVKPAQIAEHEWWQAAPLPKGVQLISTPARHFSGRSPLAKDRTLWTSWTLVGPHHRVFFSGDTGQTAAHARIAETYGPFDLALLEIGQYHPSWGDIHLGPHGALETFARLRARQLLPIHWGTFVLGLHAWSEPAETLIVEGQRRGFQILTPLLGQPIEPDAHPQTPPWWRALPPIAATCP